MIIYILFVFLLSIIILVLVILFNSRFWYTQSIYSIYECGFLPYHEARIQFESKFYMVALSFIIFDLEVCFLIPWFLTYSLLPSSSLFYFICFFLLVILGLVYEIQNGILDWNIQKKK